MTSNDPQKHPGYGEYDPTIIGSQANRDDSDSAGAESGQPSPPPLDMFKKSADGPDGAQSSAPDYPQDPYFQQTHAQSPYPSDPYSQHNDAPDPYAQPPQYPAYPGQGAPEYGAAGQGVPGYSAPGYGAPGYGAPGYGAPGYGAPGYGAGAYSAPGYPQVPSGRTNGLAIGALVCSILGICSCITAIAGVIMGIIALNQVNKSGEDGRGLALASIIVGGVVIVGYLLLIIIAFASDPTLRSWLIGSALSF